MSNNLTEIALILDQSGSMESIKAGTIEGVNAFLEQQKEEQDTHPVRLTLTLFSTSLEVPYSSVAVTEVPALNDTTYKPNGGTALLDAIGVTIDEIGKRLADTPESQRPQNVIVAIMTDGEENSSRIFNWKQISEKIKHQTEVYKWEFLFMGANQDAIATASKMSIDRDSSVNYFQRDDSSKRTLRAASQSISFSRKSPSSLKQSLAAFVADEEEKESNS